MSAPALAPAGPDVAGPSGPLGRAARRAAAVLRAVLGVPDYARYVAHMRERHPGCAVLDAAAFERERLAARYERPGSRCC